MPKFTFARVVFQPLTLLLLALTSSSAARADMVNVLTLDASRNQIGRSEDFLGGSLYTSFRNDLALDTNFGTGGIVSKDVNFLGPVGSVNSANLSAANVLIWSQRTDPTVAEKSAISSFVNGGGGLMVTSYHVAPFIDLIGGIASQMSNLQYNGRYASTASPLTSGAFSVGSLAGQSIDYTQPSNASNPSPSVGWKLVLDGGSLPIGTVTGVRNEYGDAISATRQVGLGRVAIFGDDNLFFSSNYSGPNEANRAAALNTFDWLGADSVTAVPEPSSIALVAIAIFPIACRCRQKLAMSAVRRMLLG